MNKVIDSFEGQYFFLSNFYEEAPLIFDHLLYQNSEAAFQAQKCPERRVEFSELNPSAAKKLGRKVKLRPDWDQIKDEVMYQVVKAKFEQHLDLIQALILTGDTELIEGNWWHDTYWGVCEGKGQNKLGKILMRLRTEFKKSLGVN